MYNYTLTTFTGVLFIAQKIEGLLLLHSHYLGL
jgi:hypothetical protein